MSNLQNSIDTLQSHLLFHRRKVQQYFWLLCTLVFLSFGSVIALNQISADAAVAFASEISKASHEVIQLKDNRRTYSPSIEMDLQAADLMDNASQDAYKSEYVYFGSIVLLVIAILGLIRHHLRRVSITEDRLFNIEKIHAILIEEKAYDPALVSVILGLSDHANEQSHNEPSLYPSQEILERSIDALSDISKIVGKRIKR